VNSDFVEPLFTKSMKRDESTTMSLHGKQLAMTVSSPLEFEAESPGGLRLSLMHNLTYFNYYINIVIMNSEVILR